MTIKRIILLLVISLLIFSCDEDNEVKTYSSHDVILPSNIELDDYILSIQLESTFLTKDLDQIGYRSFICHPHPILTKSTFFLSLNEIYENGLIKILNENNEKIIYEGKLEAGNYNFDFNMKELFGDDYGFYNIKVFTNNEVMNEKEILFTNTNFIYKNEDTNESYVSILFINLNDLSNNKVKFTSNIENYKNKSIDLLATDGRYLGTYYINQNINFRIALLKPYENYSIEHYAKIINYDELIKLKEIQFTENDKIKTN